MVSSLSLGAFERCAAGTEQYLNGCYYQSNGFGGVHVTSEDGRMAEFDSYGEYLVWFLRGW